MNIKDKLNDLIKQATTEKSHFYVASICKEAIAALDRNSADIVKYRLALNRITHPEVFGGVGIEPKEIARRALILGMKISPLPNKPPAPTVTISKKEFDRLTDLAWRYEELCK